MNHLQFLLSQDSVFNDDGDNGWFPHLEFVIVNTLRKETKRSHKSKKEKKIEKLDDLWETEWKSNTLK